MSVFGLYFVGNLLREAGWPRKQGLFGRESYDSIVLDAAMVQMINWAASLGAGRPVRALQMIAEMNRDRDWSGPDAPRIKDFLDEVGDAWGNDGAGPSDDIEGAIFQKHGKSISAQDFTQPQMRNILEQLCLDGLLWGLGYPDAFARWYQAQIERHEAMSPVRERAGLKIDPPLPLEQFFDDNAAILEEYESEIGMLPAVPERLVSDARSLGRAIDL